MHTVSVALALGAPQHVPWVQEGLLQYHLTGRDGWQVNQEMLAPHSDRARPRGAYMGVARVREGALLRRIDLKVYQAPEYVRYQGLPAPRVITHVRGR